MRARSSPYANCKSCRKPIVWLKTRSDKNIPVLRVDRNGEAVKAEEIFDRVVHEAHFADCKNAAAHRTPRTAAAAPPVQPWPERALDDEEWRHPSFPGSFSRLRPTQQEAKQLPIWGYTLVQPWAWAITWIREIREIPAKWAPKAPPPWWIALHAGQVYDEMAAKHLQGRICVPVPPPGELARDQIVAVCEFQGARETEDGALWRVGTVTPILPVPAPGGEALWPLSRETLAIVRLATSEARKRPLCESDVR